MPTVVIQRVGDGLFYDGMASAISALCRKQRTWKMLSAKISLAYGKRKWKRPTSVRAWFDESNPCSTRRESSVAQW